MRWQSVYEFVKKNQSFVVSSHVGLEGDAVGSVVAMAAFLRAIGKEAVIINDDAIPANLQFMSGAQTIYQACDPCSTQLLAQCDAVCIVDVSKWDHIGHTGELIQQSGKPVCCIDHHQSPRPIGDVTLIDSSASSAGYLIYDMIRNYDHALITPEIASAIYTAIITDTGNFRFSNTDRNSYLACADLIERGIDHAAICREVYENNPMTRLRLLNETLETLMHTEDGQIAWMCITQDALKQTNSSVRDSEGFVDMLRTVKGVEVSILFRELSAEKTKVTFRSKQYVDVQQLAAQFGGGGHKRAAGATITAPLAHAVDQVLILAQKMLAQ